MARTRVVSGQEEVVCPCGKYYVELGTCICNWCGDDISNLIPCLTCGKWLSQESVGPCPKCMQPDAAKRSLDYTFDPIRKQEIARRHAEQEKEANSYHTRKEQNEALGAVWGGAVGALVGVGGCNYRISLGGSEMILLINLFSGAVVGVLAGKWLAALLTLQDS